MKIQSDLLGHSILLQAQSNMESNSEIPSHSFLRRNNHRKHIFLATKLQIGKRIVNRTFEEILRLSNQIPWVALSNQIQI